MGGNPHGVKKPLGKSPLKYGPLPFIYPFSWGWGETTELLASELQAWGGDSLSPPHSLNFFIQP